MKVIIWGKYSSDLYNSLRLNIFEYTFDEHDETVRFTLHPFVSPFVFAAVMKHQEAPGTTFKKHMAKQYTSERRRLSCRNSFQPSYPGTSSQYPDELKNLLEIIENKDAEGMKKYLTKIQERLIIYLILNDQLWCHLYWIPEFLSKKNIVSKYSYICTTPYILQAYETYYFSNDLLLSIIGYLYARAFSRKMV